MKSPGSIEQGERCGISLRSRRHLPGAFRVSAPSQSRDL